MITLEQAKGLKYGDILHSEYHKNSDGSCQRWKVNGKPRTWVRSPEGVRVPLKHGLYDYDAITEQDLVDVHLESECPNNQTKTIPSPSLYPGHRTRPLVVKQYGETV